MERARNAVPKRARKPRPGALLTRIKRCPDVQCGRLQKGHFDHFVGTMIPVVVESVRINLANGQRVVILKDAKIDRYLLIWVGMQESNAIALELQDQKAKRPLTVDLLKSAIDARSSACCFSVIVFHDSQIGRNPSLIFSCASRTPLSSAPVIPA